MLPLNLPFPLCSQQWVPALRSNWITVFQPKFAKSFSFTACHFSDLSIPVQIFLYCEAWIYLPWLWGWYLFPSHCSPNHFQTFKFNRTLSSSSFFDSLLCLYTHLYSHLQLDSHLSTCWHLSYSRVNTLSLLLEFPNLPVHPLFLSPSNLFCFLLFFLPSGILGFAW